MLFILQLLSNPVFLIVIIIVIILLIREVVTWYWKINQLIDIHESQEDILKEIHNELIEIRKKL
jgi:fumarate reductase subunit C